MNDAKCSFLMHKHITSRAKLTSFVCACSTADTRSRRLFRTYEHDGIKDDCEIWEAARATSAAPKFFKRAEIITKSGVKETFVDGGFGWNNPAMELCEEARIMFPNRKIDCIISIGTGTQPDSEIPQPKWWQTRVALYVIPTVVRIATDCDKNHVHMSRNFRHIPNTYFRFDVDGMGQVGLEEWKLLGNIKGKTMAYLQKEDINERVDRAVDALYSSLSGLDSDPNG
jgi:predicted acylesterase/phospholipase RssA